MYYLLLMTFSGSLLFVGYLWWNRLWGGRVSQGMRYKALYLVLLTYAIPWGWFKKIYIGLFHALPRSQNAYETRILKSKMPVKLADISTVSEAYRTHGYVISVLAVGIWLAVAVIIMTLKLTGFCRDRRRLLSKAKLCRGNQADEIVCALRKEYHCRRRIDVYEVPEEEMTCTSGFFRPVIFLQSGYTEREMSMVLRHEMVHIVRKDALTRFILQWICCLHWFNVFVYLFRDEFDIACENSCDEKVVCRFSARERGEYARLLLKNVFGDWEKKELVCGISSDIKNAKERLRTIMKAKKVRVWEKMIGGGLLAVLLFVNSLTALAYPNVFHVDNASSETAVEAVEGDDCWVCSEGEGQSVENIVYDQQFIDEAGQIYPVENQGKRVFCFAHSIIPVYFQIHTKDDNGGCTVKSYSATLCTKCNTIWLGDLYSTTVYVKCPH